MKNLIMKLLFVGVSLVLIVNDSSAMSELKYVKIQSVDTKSQIVVIEGNQYQFKLNQDESEYNEETDTEKFVALRDVQPGNQYYVTFYSDESKSRNDKGYGFIIFIANQEPAE